MKTGVGKVFSIIFVSILVLFSNIYSSMSVSPVAARQQEVVLTMGSWRPDDVEQMNFILAQFNAQYPNITINFVPTDPPEYNDVLRSQLESNTAPDLMYLRSFAVSRQLFEEGYLEPLTDLPGLTENFTPETRVPWSTDDGTPYGVPFIATSHGIYYNATIFQELNLEIPETWTDVMTVSQTLEDNGVLPFANASGDTWTMAELIFMNIAPGFIGGREGRLEYLSGERCFNDEQMVSVFQAIQDLAPFLPPNQDLFMYSDSLQLFLQGQAAMWMGGSWDIPFLEANAPGFEWSIFPVPPPEGREGVVTFQLDAGMGLNAASTHKEEARLFLEWMTTSEFGALLGNELPGFFPMHTEAPSLSNAPANTFLAFNENNTTDIRFTWEKLMDGTPSAYMLIQEGAIAVINAEQTPQEAADALQAGLAAWYAPAQACSGSQ